jgi:GT2 family glycosyltransferase/glycosyltransferase involved in cell wall biosynthesis
VTTIDVIVSVHRGAEATRRCIDSVLAAPQETPFEIVVVNDASAEADLVHWLRELAEQRRIRLLEQPVRQGFAAAINRATALHRDLERDVVILDTCAEVANDWLDRLGRQASAGGDIGTVAPFASFGGVAGYPRSGVKNALPKGYTVASLDLLFRRANAGAAVSVPLSFGPCVYVRRECLNSVGAFDSGPLGDDGVVQDFCLRATSAGFRHLLAADVFVWNQEGGSGAIDAKELAARAEATLDKLDPHYRVERAGFVQRDPARPHQRRVDLLRLAESPRQLLLFVAHAWGGGIRRHMQELATLASERCEVLFLEPAAGDTVKLSWPKPGEDFAIYFALPQEMPALVTLLRTLGLARIHFHHIHGLPRAVLDLPAAAGVPYDCTLHDYYTICPQYHLVTEDGRYCGEPDAAGCAACISRRPGQWGLDITAWRSAFGALLRGANRVFAPSRDVAQRIARYFPDVAATVLPHAEAPAAAVPRVVRVTTLGNLSPEKGLRVVAACAADARARALPLSFRVLGSTTEPLPQWPQAALSIHGQYADDELPALIAAERPDVIWFPAQVPESYSYTLSIALTAGVAIVASALGALPERLAAHPRAVVVPWNATAAEWNDALIKAGTAASAARAPSERLAVS